MSAGRRGASRLARSAGTLTAALALGTPALQVAAADKEPEATPYRPTIAGPAALSYPGWFELELGGLRSGGHRTELRGSVPYLVKYAVSEDWGMLLGGEAFVDTRDDTGRTLRGWGDTTLTLKNRFTTGREGEAFGLETTVKQPTAKAGISDGGRDYSLNGIYSRDLPYDFHADLNLSLQRLGRVDVGQSRYFNAWAAALSRQMAQRWTVAAEISGAPSFSHLLGAASYSVNKRVVVDGGMACGLTNDSPRWSFFAGLTVLLAPGPAR